MEQKGFTLVELLAVVVVIGVLAVIVQPQIRKVTETYKALEAEHIMANVRSEQMARCTLDKDYTSDDWELASMPEHESRYFFYQLASTGMVAINLTQNYELVMKSYQFGGICCQAHTGGGAGYCTDLIRNYPLCSAYNVTDQTGCDAPEN